VVSGDLTQRARTIEFREARRFLDTLSAPKSSASFPAENQTTMSAKSYREIPYREIQTRSE